LVDPGSRAARIAQALAGLGDGRRAAQREAAATRKRCREQDKQQQQQQRAAQLDAFRRRREQRTITPMGLPPVEIRVEVLTQNLAEARAAHHAKIERYHARGKRGRKPVPVEQAYRVRRIKAGLDRAIAAEQVTQQRVQAGAAEAAVAAKPATPTRSSGPKRNITDPESRMMPLRGGGWIQSCNCQALTSSDGLIIATSVANNSSDATAFTEMMGKAIAAAALIDTHRPAAAPPTGIGVLLADAGYLSVDNLSAAGPDRLIAVGKQRELAAAAREHPTAGPPPPGATRSRRWHTDYAPPTGMPSTASAATSPKPHSLTPNTISASAASRAAESPELQPNSASTPWCTT